MADAAVDAVLELLGAPDRLEDLVTALAALDDRNRRKLSARVRSREEQIRWNDDRRATVLAVLGCVTGIRQVADAVWLAPATPDLEPLAVRVLAERQPEGLDDLPAALLAGPAAHVGHFRLVRALVRQGLVARPESPWYVDAMVAGLVIDLPGSTVLERLRADPGLLEVEVWVLLATERTGRALGYHDNFHLEPQHFGTGDPPPSRPQATWQYALTTLAAEGLVDRNRLLDTTLQAFFRDWAAVDVTWFVALHGALAPTEPEYVARQVTYGRLLAAEHGPVVKLGLTALRALLSAGHLDVDLLLTSAPAALARADKGTVVATLGLLGAAAAAQPDAAARIAEVLAAAAQHERIDVQERAIALLATLVPDAALRQSLLEPYSQHLAPSLRPRGAPSRPLAPPDPPPEPEPEPAPVPVADAEELAQLFARLIEEADDAVEVERLLDGVLRLARARPQNGADVLADRAAALLGSYWPGAWTGQDPRADLAALTLVWLRVASPGPGFRGPDLGGLNPFQTIRRVVLPPRLGPGASLGELVCRRVHEVAVAVHAGGGRSLSFPTTRTGDVSADALQQRVQDLGARADVLPIDACVALLRVPPEERDGLDFPRSSRVGRFLRDQVRAMGDRRPHWEPAVDGAERERRDPRHAARPTRFTWRDVGAVPRDLDRTLLAVLDRSDPLGTFGVEVEDGEYAARFEQVTAQWPLLLPHDPDLLAARAHPRLYRGLFLNRSGSEPLLESSARTARPLGAPALSALLLGMSAKSGTERTRAVDALIDLGRCSLLDGAGLGRVLTHLLGAEAVIGTRVAQAMADAARAEPRAGDALLDCLVTALMAFDGRRDAHLFINLVAQLASERGRVVTLPEVFATAAAGTSKSQLAQACRRVPRPR